MELNVHTIMSINILFSTYDGGYGTGEMRKPAVFKRIKEVDPDTFGVQECDYWWYDTLVEEFGEEYGVVGEVNDYQWQKWRNPVFYRKSKFELVETGTKWLSDTPDERESGRAPSRQCRIMTYAKLRDKETGKIFAHCNTHLDFEQVRPYQDEILTKLVKEVGCPFLLTGDFNNHLFQPTRDDFHPFMNGKGFISAGDLIEPQNRAGLDFVFVPADNSVVVDSHELLCNKSELGGFVSDHWQVKVTYHLA